MLNRRKEGQKQKHKKDEKGNKQRRAKRIERQKSKKSNDEMRQEGKWSKLVKNADTMGKKN